jgi:hypothetical protein
LLAGARKSRDLLPRIFTTKNTNRTKGAENLGREMKRSRFLKGCMLAGFVFFAVSCVHAGDRRAGPPDQSDALLLASESSGLPVLEVPERVYDFGEHKGEGVIDHDFRLINSGTGVLRIVKLLPS